MQTINNRFATIQSLLDEQGLLDLLELVKNSERHYNNCELQMAQHTLIFASNRAKALHGKSEKDIVVVRLENLIQAIKEERQK